MEANIAEVVLLNIVIIIITIILVTVNQMEGNIAEVVLTFLLLLLLHIAIISFHVPWLLRCLQVKSTLLDDIQKIMQEGDSREKVPHKSDSINALR